MWDLYPVTKFSNALPDEFYVNMKGELILIDVVTLAPGQSGFLS